MTSGAASNFQRRGAASNAQVGDDFEIEAKKYFDSIGVVLQRRYRAPIGFSSKQKKEFDLGSAEPQILVECKSHTWTESDGVPSAKIAAWNEAMFYFSLAPEGYRKILFVEQRTRQVKNRKEESLAKYYVDHYSHLIPEGVEILEYDGAEATRVWPSNG